MDDYDLLQNAAIFAFPGSQIHADKTVALAQEISAAVIVREQLKIPIDPSAVARKREVPLDRLLGVYALATAMEMTCRILPPEDLQYSGNEEICLDVDQLALPQALFVGEEPEWYFDEARTHWSEFASQVPIIEGASVQRALSSINQPQASVARSIEQFMRLVNSGELRLEDYRYLPAE